MAQAGTKDRKPDPRESEAQRVLSWRIDEFYQELKDTGLSRTAARSYARSLACSPAERETVMRMLAGGCSPELLLEILL